MYKHDTKLSTEYWNSKTKQPNPRISWKIKGIYNSYLQQFETIKTFGDSIYNGKVNIDEVEMDQSNLLRNMVEFNNKSRIRNKEGKTKKRDTFGSVNALYEGRELTLNAFKSRIFPIKAKKGEGLKILTPKQMLQRLLIAHVQVKAGNTSEKLLNEIRQIIYSLYRSKKITKKVHNNIINSIKV